MRNSDRWPDVYKTLRLKVLILKKLKNVFRSGRSLSLQSSGQIIRQDDLSYPFKSEDKILWCYGTHSLPTLDSLEF